MEDVVVLIVGAGPSGLATSACLTNLFIPHLILEKEDCNTSLWRKYTYDRAYLHLPKQMCSLPFMPHSDESPTYISKADFLEYIDNYVARFNIKPRYRRNVVKAEFDEESEKWRVEAVNAEGVVEVYGAKFLVVASGENDVGYIPKIDGLPDFKGDVVHSKHYKNGQMYEGKNVLVVGCGNSGMEIALDLSNFGAHTSIVVRSPVHVLSKEMMSWGLKWSEIFPVSVVDAILTFSSRLEMGDLSKFGIHRPSRGPLLTKITTGRTPVIDCGTVARIQSREIKVVPGIEKIYEKTVLFSNGAEQEFDVIVFSTGYRGGACKWLKDDNFMLADNGMPKKKYPEHWKGKNGVYCAGLARMGLFGLSKDALSIANDIHERISSEDYRSKLVVPSSASVRLAS